MSGKTIEGGDAAADGIVVRRAERGWQVGDEHAADLTSAMVQIRAVPSQVTERGQPRGGRLLQVTVHMLWINGGITMSGAG